MTQRVFVDANVLVSRTCRDWLLLLRRDNEGMFQLHSTEDVLAEVLRSLRKRNPRLPGGVVHQLAQRIRACVDEVLSDFSGEETFTGSDAGDYHVHAAAIGSRADILLTANDPADFTAAPDDEPYEIMHPDDFFLLVADSNPCCVHPIVENQFRYWSARAEREGDACQLDGALRRAGCPQFADRVQAALREMAVRGF